MKNFNSTVASILLIFSAITLTSCVDDKVEVVTTYYGEKESAMLKNHLNIPDFPYDYTFTLPKHTFLFSTPINADMATLGRVLFYDKNLSKDKTISCASCHKQELAFSDDVAFSVGVENRATARNSISLGSVLNFAAYYGDFGGVPFFWDNRAARVQDQSKATLANPSEMDMKMYEVVDRVNNLEYYKPLIREAFKKKGEITETEVLDAIGTFVNSLTNFNTKFDVELDKVGTGGVNKKFSGFSDSENNGKTIYLQHCASCHGSNSARPPVLSANNGLMNTYEDKGVGSNTGNAKDEALFKVPTLRNISRSAPYMHNGMFATLAEVIEHYSSGIKNHKNLSSALKSSNNTPKKLNLSQQQKEDLLSFLLTLSDEKITTDVKFSDPFVK